MRYGSSFKLFVRVQYLTVDSCTFSDFNSSTLPGCLFLHGSKHRVNYQKPPQISTIEGPRIGSIVVRNSFITNNTGRYMGPSEDYPGPGIMLVDLSGLPIDMYFDVVHYEILIENCNITNNAFVGKATPFLSTIYSQNFSTKFLLMNSYFSDTSITPYKGDYGFDSFPLLSLAMSTNTLISFTVKKSSFINCSLPLSALLTSYISVNVEVNVFDFKFHSHNMPLNCKSFKICQALQQVTSIQTSQVTLKVLPS